MIVYTTYMLNYLLMFTAYASNIKMRRELKFVGNQEIGFCVTKSVSTNVTIIRI